MGRDKFLEEVWAWKAESGGAIVGQLKAPRRLLRLGRERFTLDEGLSKAVAKVFVQLHREGLIYRDKRLVNWDPKFQTAISDLEVQQIECKGSFKWSREAGEPLDEAALGKSRWPRTRTAISTISTIRWSTKPARRPARSSPSPPRGPRRCSATRPSRCIRRTSATGVCVGRKLRLPLVGRLIPIIADEYSDPEKGTGAVKITPAHDFNDFEVGRRHEAEGVQADQRPRRRGRASR